VEDVEIKLSLMPKQTYGRLEVYLHQFLISKLDGDEWLASRHGHFTPKERNPIPTG
jgi:hypothetical protein